MKEIELIRYLLDEIEKEAKYKEDYENAKEVAKKKATKEGKADGRYHGYWDYIPEEFLRTPREAHTKRCAMLIRELCLKMYK